MDEKRTHTVPKTSINKYLKRQWQQILCSLERAFAITNKACHSLFISCLTFEILRRKHTSCPGICFSRYIHVTLTSSDQKELPETSSYLLWDITRSLKPFWPTILCLYTLDHGLLQIQSFDWLLNHGLFVIVHG